ncbi:IS21 family transposase, partial [Cereibacter changlensis JA139]
MDEEALERRLFPPLPPSKGRQFAEVDWAAIHRELKQPGVTLALLWDEYRGRRPGGYGYSAFCQHYRRWVGRLSTVMRQRHAAGERMFVDYSGARMAVIDPTTGAARPATRAFAAFGAAPALVASDNLKSGVIRACFYEPEINRSYAEMAAHYGTAILPAR